MVYPYTGMLTLEETIKLPQQLRMLMYDTAIRTLQETQDEAKRAKLVFWLAELETALGRPPTLWQRLR